MQFHLKTSSAAPASPAHLTAFVTADRTPQQHLASCRACLIGASERLATFRRLGCLNSIDRELHANAVQDLYYALDLVWAAQLAGAR